MALSRVKTWESSDSVTAADLNAEFNNILTYLNAGIDNAALASPLTMPGDLNMNFNSILNPRRVSKVRYAYPGDDVQALIDDIVANDNGGVVYLLPGTHALGSTTLSLTANVSLIGLSSQVVDLTSTAATVITVDGSVSTNVTLGGFSLQTVAANDNCINVDSSSVADYISGIKVVDVFLDNGFSGSSCNGIVGTTNTSGVRVEHVRMGAMTNGIVIPSNGNRWFMKQCPLITSTYGIDMNNAGSNNVVEQCWFSSTGTASIRMNTQIVPHIRDCYFAGAATDGIALETSGSADNQNNRGGSISNCYFDGSGTSAIKMLGARGMSIAHNYFANTYTSAAVTYTGGNSKGNFWVCNDCDETPWPAAPRTEMPFRLEIPNSTYGRTNAYVAIFPIYDGTPSETSSWTGRETGLMWVNDGNIGSSPGNERIGYYNYAGNVVQVPDMQ